MEELIKEYLEMRYTTEGDVTVFTIDKGSKAHKTYFPKIIENLTNIFNINEYKAEGYLIVFLLELNPDFGYTNFKSMKPLSFESNRRYMDDAAIAASYAILHNMRNNFGELDHPNETPFFNTAVGVSSRLMNLDLAPIDDNDLNGLDDLEE